MAGMALLLAASQRASGPGMVALRSKHSGCRRSSMACFPAPRGAPGPSPAGASSHSSACLCPHLLKGLPVGDALGVEHRVQVHVHQVVEVLSVGGGNGVAGAVCRCRGRRGSQQGCAGERRRHAAGRKGTGKSWSACALNERVWIAADVRQANLAGLQCATASPGLLAAATGGKHLHPHHAHPTPGPWALGRTPQAHLGR
jgi:hypothetical protein